MSHHHTDDDVAPHIVDSHVHIWDLDRNAYAWLGPQHGILFRPYLPQEAQETLESCQVAAGILVQAEDSLAETRYMLEVADAHPWVAGVVGWVPLDQPEQARAALAQWLQHPAFCGVRHLIHDDPRDDFLYLPSVRESLQALAVANVALDVPDAWPRHLQATVDLARDMPELRIVVDHLGKPPLEEDAFRRWAACIDQLGACPNVVAKVSGLGYLTDDQLERAVDVAVAAFGTERLMFGGDWPVSALHLGYADTLSTLCGAIGKYLVTKDLRAAFWGGTALRVYQR